MATKHNNPFGKGITDLPTKENGKATKAYTLWFSLLQRCYDPIWKSNPTNAKAYDGVKLCEEWHYFSKFKSWFDEHYVEGWQLDKDILSTDSKIYSPETCVFVPRVINMFVSTSGKKGQGLLTGVYRKGSKYAGQCKDPIRKKMLYLGMFEHELDAHQAHIKRKGEIALELIAMHPQLDTRASTALVNRYN